MAKQPKQPKQPNEGEDLQDQPAPTGVFHAVIDRVAQNGVHLAVCAENAMLSGRFIHGDYWDTVAEKKFADMRDDFEGKLRANAENAVRNEKQKKISSDITEAAKAGDTEKVEKLITEAKKLKFGKAAKVRVELDYAKACNIPRTVRAAR